jgi:RsmE family RNA methyltransferase
MINYDLFFLHEEDEHIGHDIFIRHKGEVNHIGNVLRKKVGDRISLADDSHRYDVEITEISKTEISAEIINTVGIDSPNPKILLYPALLKGAQFDLQIEKSVELGCHGFQPLITDRVIANRNKVEK